MPAPPLEFSPGVRLGDVLAGKYKVERVLGRGGMGVVVAAHHIHLDERVAIKFLLPHGVADAEAMERFGREARAAVKIKSEHVARIIDVGSLESGAPYIVMEYLEGGDLARWLRTSGLMPIEQAVELVLQVCEAIAEAHALGIVHRDLKPANLFWVRRPDGLLSVKVLDFGISKVTPLGGTDGDPSVTRTNTFVGSPHYMSPEQMRSSRDVDARADVWSLGAILFQLVTGRRPFEAEQLPDLFVKIATAPAPSVRSLRPDVPPKLERAVQRCLEKDLDRRFANVAELALALAEFAPTSRARASVERVVRVTQAAQPSSVLTPSHALPAAPVVTQATWETPGAGARRGRTAVAVAVIALAATGGFALVRALRSSSEGGSAASALPASASAASSVDPVLEETVPASAESAAPLAPPSDVVSAIARASASALPSAVKAAPTATGRTAPTAPTPACRIVTEHDDEGQPHFKKVCR
jgi:serine/threonine-protein kinase